LPWYRLEWRLRQKFLFLYIFAASKAISSFNAAHDGQVLHYLRATRFEVGLLLNFGPRPQFRRFILEETRKRSVSLRANPRSKL
jgi:hypothetical protein